MTCTVPADIILYAGATKPECWEVTVEDDEVDFLAVVSVSARAILTDGREVAQSVEIVSRTEHTIVLRHVFDLAGLEFPSRATGRLLITMPVTPEGAIRVVPVPLRILPW